MQVPWILIKVPAVLTIFLNVTFIFKDYSIKINHCRAATTEYVCTPVFNQK